MSFDPNSPTVVEGINDEPINKELKIFGRDLNRVPCFKETFLYGIVGSVGTGLVTFTATSRVGTATNAAVFSFVGIGLIYWCNCRKKWSDSKFTIAQTQRALQEMDRRKSLLDQINDNQTKD